MGQVDVLFAWPVDWIGQAIDFVEGPGHDPCHTGIIIGGELYEALPDGFAKASPDKYEGRKTEVKSVDVPDMAAAKFEAHRLLYTPYGYLDGINGGIHELTGKTVPGDGEITVNCSEAVTRILRVGGVNVLPGVYADCVTPKDLYQALGG